MRRRRRGGEGGGGEEKTLFLLKVYLFHAPTASFNDTPQYRGSPLY
jgi:hypothetical protein